ncbi:MAG: hypothetical protein DUD27_03880 [Lachnospiraceae bacterium]|uniref:Uncharacterized protein n=1 Tax=Candidatus Weimeria bifida TaxID=2599074 RepID=A0A6N7IZS4_9FIRM|nr:hypothetical protein [Candidatus Weimeria bifida]RRF96487.1 MAG: hypothetical protein DUD27_03880 [Lachnospiraceae bacterium]
MKHVVLALISTSVAVLVVIILMTVHSKDLRQTELERALKLSAKQSLENACLSQKTEINDNDALTADFIRSFLGKMKTTGRVVSENGEVYATDATDNGQIIEITIKAADIYKGILSASVKENFTYPNGGKGTVTASTIQIVERESKRPSECISYYIPWQVAKEAGFDYYEGADFLYYQKRYTKGMNVSTDISAPEYKGHSFVRWDEQRENNGIRLTAVYN